MARVPHVVADTGAFLSAAPLQDIADALYTVPEVLAEIRDRPTRRRLAALPCELRVRRPRPELLRLVTEFSKKTGDYPSLSAADLQVLALTCQLQAEIDGPGCLRWEPQDKVRLSSTPRHPEAPLHLAGFHLPKVRHGGGRGAAAARSPREGCTPVLCPQHKPAAKGPHQPGPGDPAPAESDEFGSFLYWRPPLPSIEEELRELLAISDSPEPLEEHRSSADGASAGEEEEDEESDDEGWITPSNLKQAQQDTGHCDTAPIGIQVGCVTTDFAMQNVLLQMGLHVLAVNGMLIRRARSYILRCHGCFRTTSDMTKVFCPHCGNKTLKKVAVSVSDDGSLHMHFSRNPKVLNPRGLRYPLPAPQGGKHANNPHLVEDQRFPQQRLSRKARQKTNVFDPDYLAGASPFAENDVHSRAAHLHLRDAALGAGRRRLNPNAVTKKFVRRR
ncbi:PREDICTED: LOW QUALITY PROTEIN: RNA-binding protein NOB1 [Sturnus vulgaris]|uniref:LOW QUALITY PROTEIN: RNA-binding protein NOB1 n=1 Tax=Sturnus vulgaris TaxID=9172 RepID=UPI00071A30C9|nr:PREDICTED: LOW QUALITY PROTEIN: RNA-binding protein NOB1 [Sturnus vulgaris]